MRISDWSSDVSSSDLALPRTSFVATDAPYCAGDDMQLLAAYGASVGSRTARMMGAKGFLGSSTGLAAPMFGGTAGAWSSSEERRVGKEGVSTGRSRGSRDPSKKK